MSSFLLRTPDVTKPVFLPKFPVSKKHSLGNSELVQDRQFTIASLFSGAGGLDLGFKNAGFKTVWANEFDPKIWPTFNYNFPQTYLDKRSIVEIKASDIPKVDGIIGGPPCQSWSEAGAGRGIEDNRGRLFFEYIRILKEKQPSFFLAENVPGILHKKHFSSFKAILEQLEEAGYNVSYKLLNAHDYGVPQDRYRVIIIGVNKKKVGYNFQFPEQSDNKLTLQDSIADLQHSALPAMPGNKTNGDTLEVANHEYMTGDFSTLYMSRNRVRSWHEPSFTIQAGGRHAPLHPQAPKMQFINPSQRIFVPGQEHLYRRLSVRECARIQTFPDSYVFECNNILDGYKMIGNAVPVNFAFQLARKIKASLVTTMYG